MVLDHAQVVAAQVFILFLLIGMGFLAGKTRMVNETGLRQMTDLLLIFVTPCVIVRAFQIPFSVSLLRGLLIALASALATHALGAGLSWFVFRRQVAAQNRVLRFAVVFTNCIFMCLPLLDAVLGSRGVFYGSVYIAVFNLAQWTYGIILMTGSRSRIKLRQALINPGTVAILIALPLFLARIVLPDLLMTVIGHVANLNTPLAMFVIGGQMAGMAAGALWGNRQAYWALLLRLLAVPLLMLLMLHLLPLDRELLLACLIPAAAPTAAVTALFAVRFDQDRQLATQTITLSTLFSIITLPLLILLSDWLGYA